MVRVAACGGALIGLWFEGQKHDVLPSEGWRESSEDPLLGDALRQLREYLAGKRTSFDLQIAPEGTAFQKRVWQAITEIPMGQTATYSDLARRIGSPSAVRAVGAAVGRNPLSVIVPCHRIVGSNGTLTGYAGGLDRKRALLTLEGVKSPPFVNTTYTLPIVGLIAAFSLGVISCKKQSENIHVEVRDKPIQSAAVAKATTVHSSKTAPSVSVGIVAAPSASSSQSAGGAPPVLSAAASAQPTGEKKDACPSGMKRLDNLEFCVKLPEKYLNVTWEESNGSGQMELEDSITKERLEFAWNPLTNFKNKSLLELVRKPLIPRYELVESGETTDGAWSDVKSPQGEHLIRSMTKGTKYVLTCAYSAKEEHVEAGRAVCKSVKKY